MEFGVAGKSYSLSLLGLASIVFSAFAVASSSGAIVTGTSFPTPTEVVAKIPLRFESESDGRESGMFLARMPHCKVSVKAAAVELTLHGNDREHFVRIEFVNGNHEAQGIGIGEQGIVSYLVGNNPKSWRAGIRTYLKVRYENVYPGIDVVFYGRGGELEYDFEVAPGADPAQIEMKIVGADLLTVKSDGDLRIPLKNDEVVLRKPQLYQLGGDGKKRSVIGRYQLGKENTVRFVLGTYARSQALVIDPAVVYATALGGSKGDFIYAGTGAVDLAGNLYVLGATESFDFPVSRDAFQTSNRTDPTCSPLLNGFCTDLFVAKLDPTGSKVIYSTYIGGSKADIPAGIVIDAEGNAIITGSTNSPNFPVKNAFQGTFGGGDTQGDAFLLKLNPDGTALVFSTFLGGKGNDEGAEIAMDKTGAIYVFGGTECLGFPFTPGVFKSQCDIVAGQPLAEAFVAKFDGAGHLVYSTLTNTAGTIFTVDTDGFVYLASSAAQLNPTPGSYVDPKSARGFPMTVAKMNQTGSGYVFVAQVGDGVPNKLVLDSMGNIYTVGETQGALTTTPGAFESDFTVGEFCEPPAPGAPPCSNTFAAKLDNSGAVLLYATFLRAPAVFGEVITATGQAYTLTNSKLIPPTPDAFCTDASCTGGLLIRLNSAGTAVEFASNAWGASSTVAALDAAGNLYMTGIANPGFHGTPGAFQSTFQGGDGDGFATKIAFPPATPSDFSVGLSASSMTVAPGQSITVEVAAAGNQGFREPIALSCSGLPQGGTCGFSANPLMPNSGNATSILTIQIPTLVGRGNETSSGGFKVWLALCLVPLAGVFAVSRKRRALLNGVALFVTLIGCGNGTPSLSLSSSPSPSPSPSPALDQQIVVTVNAVASSTRHSASITVTIH